MDIINEYHISGLDLPQLENYILNMERCALSIIKNIF